MAPSVGQMGQYILQEKFRFNTISKIHKEIKSSILGQEMFSNETTQFVGIQLQQSNFIFATGK